MRSSLVVKCMVDEDRVSLTAKDNGGWQPIHVACGNGHLELVKWLEEQDMVSLTAKTKKGSQPIHRACAPFVCVSAGGLAMLLLPSSFACVRA
jgi:hypothetical protein